MEKNILLTIEYDGSNFHGWQRQPGTRTCQGEIEKTLTILCGREIEIEGVSRTDAGVHALDQKATLRGDFAIPTDRMLIAANNLLSSGKNTMKMGDIRIKSIEEKPMDFHARFDCTGKKYIYRILNDKFPDIFRRDRCWHIEKPLDTGLMNEAGTYIVGTHDFACFQAAGGQERKTTVRTVHSLSVEKEEKDIVITIEGDGFLYNMVRIITGTLVEVGKGKLDPEILKNIIDSRDRQMAGPTAPPQGLYLAEVYY